MITRYIHLIILLLALALSACSASYKELSNNNYTSSDTFAKTLIDEYKIKADFEAKEMHDWDSAKLYSEKAIKAYRGKVIKPEPINKWKITEKNSSELNKAYNNLMTIYKSALKEDPFNLAKAIVSLDCWSEQEEEGWQTTHIQKCKSDYLNSVNKIYTKLSNKEKDKNNTEDNILIVTQKKNVNEKIIYFNFNDFILSNNNMIELKKYISNDKIDKYIIIGHADSKGTNNYNYNLSWKRAYEVSKFLINTGINKNKIKIIAKGENDLAVPTPDNVAHPANRRVEIQPSY